MRDVQPEIEGRGARLFAVGNGGPHFARAFVEDRGITFPVYVDPQRVTYRAAGLRRGVASTFRLGVVKRGLRALGKGHVQGRTQGDPWQQGGVFVLGPGNKDHFAYVSDEAGDHPDVGTVLSAIPSGPTV